MNCRKSDCERIFKLSVWVATLVLSSAAFAQTYTVLHNFTGGADGSYSYAGLTQDRAGNFYGTTGGGGTGDCHIQTGCGTVFKMTHSGSGWIVTPIYAFRDQPGTYPDGSNPYARVIIGPDGALYGTTSSGGTQCLPLGCGTVYRLTPQASACKSALCPWNETLIHNFAGPREDGDAPGYGDLTFDSSGNLYGTTVEGGNGCSGLSCGTVFELSRSGGSWAESYVFSFQLPLGINPYSGVTFDSDGNLFGTTGSPYGTIYKLEPVHGWLSVMLHQFSSDTEDYPYGGLIPDGAGGFYGTTAGGGSGHGGTVFQLAPNGGSWTYNVIYSFTTFSGVYNPGPVSNLAMDAAGNLYGTTTVDGANNCGSVFKLSHSGGSWTHTTLHDFGCHADGNLPWGGVLIGQDGNLYGTTTYGGTHEIGVIWQIQP